MKKILAILLAMTMIIGLAASALADGTDGVITVYNAVDGQTYTLYKILDATYNADTGTTAYYTTDATLAADANSPFEFAPADAEGRYYVIGDEPAIADIKDWIGEGGENHAPNSYVTEIDSQEFDGNPSNTVTFSGLEYGYYYITSTLGAIVTIDSANTTAKVYDKNPSGPVPPPEGPKKIVDAETGDLLDYTTAEIGQEINFQVTFYATNYVTENEETEQVLWYEIEDTSSGLSKATLDKVTVDGDELTEDTDFTVTSEDPLTIRIPWVDDPDADEPNSLYNANAEVVITYKATLEDVEAENDVVISNSTGSHEIPGHTDIYTGTLTINKVDENGEALDGAWFALTDAEGNNINVVKTADGYSVAKAGTDGILTFDGEEEDQYIVAGTGVTVVGLDGTKNYSLVEKKAPDGYNMLANPETTITEDDSGDYKWNVETTDSEDAEGNTTTTYDYTVEVEIENQSGTTLPSTGGIGTTIFYVVGGLLAVGAGVVLVTKKRMSKEEI